MMNEMNDLQVVVCWVALAIFLVTMVGLFVTIRRKSSGVIRYYDELWKDEKDNDDDAVKTPLLLNVCQRIWAILYGSQPFPTAGVCDDDDVRDRFDGLFLSLRLNPADMEKVRKTVVEAMRNNTCSNPLVDAFIIDEICGRVPTPAK